MRLFAHPDFTQKIMRLPAEDAKDILLSCGNVIRRIPWESINKDAQNIYDEYIVPSFTVYSIQKSYTKTVMNMYAAEFSIFSEWEIEAMITSAWFPKFTILFNDIIHIDHNNIIDEHQTLSKKDSHFWSKFITLNKDSLQNLPISWNVLEILICVRIEQLSSPE